jgi:rhodanese-related sulfurtransferase
MTPPLVIDVREPREFKQVHSKASSSRCLNLSQKPDLPLIERLFWSAAGRRSLRAAHLLKGKMALTFAFYAAECWPGSG